MPMKASGPPTGYERIDEWEGGVGWIAHPDESMQRASHALCVDRTDDEAAPPDAWVIDPLRAPGIEDHLRDLGNVVGVVVLLDRHERDAATFARRFDVPLYVPAWIDVHVPDDVGLVRIEDALPGTGFDVIETVDLPGWHEAALYDGETLVLADALGTASYFTTRDETIGVHPFLRVMPPTRLRGLTPTRILVGHGTGRHERATRELRDALENARRRGPRVWWNALSSPVKRAIGSRQEGDQDDGAEAESVSGTDSDRSGGSP